MSTTELVKSISVENLLNQRGAVLQQLQLAADALSHVNTICHAMAEDVSHHRLHNGVADLLCSQSYAHAFSFLGNDGLAKAMKRFDAAAWEHLMHKSGMRSLMDAEARKTWDKAIAERDVPELTRANIESTFSMLYEGRAAMFERGVIELFQRLAWCYKTNQPQKFGKRIVVNHINGTWSRGDRMDDLLRVLHVLDGKPEPDHRNGFHSMLNGAGLAYQNRPGIVENEYVRVRVFKNRNGHVTFKRPELVDKMNLIIAKHYPGALPAPKH